jgi:hypothetical protein
MMPLELYIVAIASVGLAVWVRGCFKNSYGDCALGLLIGCVSCVGYFFFFSQTHVSYLAAIILSVFLLSILPFPRVLRSGLGRVLVAACVILVTAVVLIEYKLISTGNALLVIEPYRAGKEWRFDEPQLHLKGEPFVEGVSELIDKMVVGIPGADKKVRLIFSQQPFPGSRWRLDRVRADEGGNWYFSEDYQMTGWLCPALFKFFPRAPQHIYVSAEEAN